MQKDSVTFVPHQFSPLGRYPCVHVAELVFLYYMLLLDEMLVSGTLGLCSLQPQAVLVLHGGIGV